MFSLSNLPGSIVFVIIFVISMGLAYSEDRADGFYDITGPSGVDFVHTDGASGKYFLIETVTAGLGAFDYDNDGDIDLYFVNGAALPGREFDTPPVNRLYRNDGNLKFTDVTEESGAGDPGYGMGCVMGDYDNDGDQDIFVSNFGDDALLRNNGDGTFINVTTTAGVNDPRAGAGSVFADFNNDGWLDLFVANYVDCPTDKEETCTRLGVRLYCDPSTFENVYPPQLSSMYFNNGDGTFRNVSKESGIENFEGRGMGVATADYDQDGDVDIYIANDVSANFLWTNDGTGAFEEMGMFTGVAYDQHGREQGSMGCDWGDFDGDGWQDVIVTSYQRQSNTLYRNTADGAFQDVTIPAGVLGGSMENVSWAALFFDYDNDADNDLFIAHGHLQVNIEDLEPAVHYKHPDQLFQNDGGKFTDVSQAAGPGFQVARSTRGGVYADLDNDGDLDIITNNSRDKALVLENVCNNGNEWITLKLQGSESNRDAIGARVTVRVGDHKQYKEV
ncbi:VCBS repeat-containing protein, partial [bacterium]|nr:VCBS repeat-containing protein [bacterium]